MQENPPIKVSADFSAETLQDRREWHDIFIELKEKTSNQEYSTQKSCSSELERSSISQTIKPEGVHYQQTGPAKNVKGTFKTE